MNFPSLLSYRSILKTLIYSLLIYKFGNLNYATLAAFIERFTEFTKIHGAHGGNQARAPGNHYCGTKSNTGAC
jgi:hypothetical protein